MLDRQHTPASPRPARPAARVVSLAPTPTVEPHVAPGRARLQSLDVFRGMAIAAMILVNNPGRWRPVYGPLQHADWNGWTAADLIFPAFLFIVGAAIAFALVPRIDTYSRPALLWKVMRRTLIIFGLGIVLNGLPYFQWDVIRIPGVLQRIAVCYLCAALIAMWSGVRAQALIAAALLLAYWVLMRAVPVPGIGHAAHGPGTNLAAYVDNAVLHGHLLYHRWDPEGVLSTLPAIATTLLGVLTGHWLRTPRSSLERAAGLFVAGNVGLLLGTIMDWWFPINKHLWTSSYVVFTAGMSLNALAVIYWLVDLKGFRRWALPFVIFGTNPLLAYVLSSMLAKALLLVHVTQADGSRVILRRYIFEHAFLPWASPVNASLFYAIAYVLLWLGLTAILYRRRIFVKI